MIRKTVKTRKFFARDPRMGSGFVRSINLLQLLQDNSLDTKEIRIELGKNIKIRTLFLREVRIWIQESKYIPCITCMKRACTKSFKLLNCVIRSINDCLIPIDNRERLMLLCSSNDSMKLLHRYSHARNSFRVFN